MSGRTRIESRTLWLFVASALLPVIAFAVLAFVAVTGELRQVAQQRLDAAAKSYGLAVFDRLRQIDADATQVARRYLQGERIEAAQWRDERGTLRILSADKASAAAGQAPAITRQLHTVRRDDTVRAVLVIAARSDAGSIRLEAEPDPAYLWNGDAVLPAQSSVCIRMGAPGTVHCRDAANDVYLPTASDDPSDLLSSWDLFLNATYAVPAWHIEVRQSREAAFRALNAFRWVLPLSAALAVAIALLLGAVFIRRSHAPLRQLTQAARRIARQDFSQPIRIRSHDEYGRLARTFNRMAGNLRDQFSLLSNLTRVDDAILSHAGAAAAVEALLPQLPRLMGSQFAAVVLIDDDPALMQARVSTANGSVHTFPIPSDRLTLPHIETGSPQRVSGRSASVLLECMGAAYPENIVVLPIRAAERVRGYVITGDERFGRFASQKLQGIAQRIAVAIGHDDHQKALWRQAHHDSLTGLANRALLRQRLGEALQSSRESGSSGAVLFFDLDRFKAVNDSLGHSIGDLLLVQIAQRIAAQLPQTATAARFGGDEFVILVPSATQDEALAYAHQLLALVGDPCHLQELRYVATASVGIALFPGHGLSVDAVLKNADIAMYRAKAGGRGRICLFDSAMSVAASDRLRLEQQLRAAVQGDRIRAYFQPKVDATGAIVAAEALARWHTEDGRAVSPASFIPLAEETGLIVPLGESMLRQACRQIREWREAGVRVTHIAVNISLLQLRDAAFPEFVRRCLAEHELDGGCLELELTESLFAEDGAAIARQLSQLREMGIRIAIDDFGTGFSSMSRLREYPISTLKIDRSFVDDCGRSDEARLLLKALIDVGHALNLTVVAEGVEDQSQLATLRELGCNLMQGYLFARALSPHEFAALLSARGSVLAPMRQAG